MPSDPIQLTVLCCCLALLTVMFLGSVSDDYWR
jgi:predicted metal-binding membrane protein